jgi:hypothetical protein
LKDGLLLVLEHAIEGIAHDSDEHVKDDYINEESRGNEECPVDSVLILSNL